MNSHFICNCFLIKGASIFKGIGDLANKESDRIAEMQKILRQIKIKSKFSKGELKILARKNKC